MSLIDLFVLTSGERDTALAFSGPNVAIAPRAVEGETPGDGTNLNPDAENYEIDATVSLAGAYVAPKRIVDDEEYQEEAPGMVAFLLTLPWCSLETDTIFAPAEEPIEGPW